MEQFDEKQLSEEKKEGKSVLAEDDFKDFIKFRKIKPEDFHLIEKLSHYPKDFFIELHNYFGFSRENTVPDLERDIKHKREEIERIRGGELKSLLEKRAEVLSSFLEFAKKYDWTTCMHLNGVFERRKEPESKESF